MTGNINLRRTASTLVLMAGLSASALALGVFKGPEGTTNPPPDVLKKVGIEQRLNQQIPLDLKFRDESGREVKLGDYFGQRPVVLSMVYYECPMLCGEVLNGEASVFSALKFDIGKEFEVVTVSFDPTETPDLARAKKHNFVARYGRPGGDQGWHFLTGDKASIDALTKAVGFNYAWDRDTKQFAHAAAIMVVTPDGRLAQYFYGVEYSPKDLRFGLVQASQNKIGNVVDQVLLYCYHYDPRTGKYGPVISRALSIGGGLTVLILGGFLIIMFRLEPKNRDALGQSGQRGHK
ncbi:MAG: SCO family protein [Terriglobales bacterium]